MSTFRNVAVAACVASAIALAPAAGRAQTDPEAIDLARQLMQVTLVDQLQRQMVDQSWAQMEALIHQSAPEVTSDQFVELKSEFAAIAEKDIAASLASVPAVYAKHFSAQELKDMLAFYETPTGRKTITVMPALMGELMQTLTPQMLESAKRMQEAFTRVLAKKGIDLKPAPR
ncbi:DUF2059 domain-containing protein [Methylopila sp. Yamaguchi]|uniref:DUF2059 domain-containing protein n=1 Tax=Methylopila sp. Yamaguchi TaxID=1437817 RepID=UPI000CBDBA60|nr:DUF2059 domain-containing protein [Methylopila sp. Yamaguchi]GBD50706.1 hypothetical protein METY_3919 [Methylopila sp. Yamaguchi]